MKKEKRNKMVALTIKEEMTYTPEYREYMEGRLNYLEGDATSCCFVQEQEAEEVVKNIVNDLKKHYMIFTEIINVDDFSFDVVECFNGKKSVSEHHCFSYTVNPIRCNWVNTLTKISIRDDSKYVSGKSNTGGCYSFTTTYYKKNNKWFRTETTSGEFCPYCRSFDCCGNCREAEEAENEVFSADEVMKTLLHHASSDEEKVFVKWE